MASDAQTSSQPAPVEALSSMAPEELKFNDITEATLFPPLTEFPFWLLMFSFGLIGAIVAVYFLIKSKRTPSLEAKNYYSLALKELPQIKKRIPEESLGQTASNLSLLLRNALKGATKSPALFQTQNEFLSDDTLSLTTQALSQRTVAHLNELWALEYARPTHNTGQAHDLAKRTESILQALSQS